MEYFEDLTVGDTDEYGSYEVTAAEITDFAERYDPQPFHTDPEAAADSPFGGLVASGWHTAAMTMRLLVDNHLSEGATRGGLGVDELRWRRPVRPDDELTVTTEIVDKDGWDGESGLASVAVTTEADGEEVLSMVALVLYERREKQ
ncbi:MaoC family dehydratase [Halosimplex rubrum]|uniref:MaoC family dehydratase n=1 Tax=Halosimplex rubrum TaxID=869889 RepID=A0A7D5SZX4_9EURY|nr:MaoC family dehydratase [Halosimplex rubrum]QLH77508.1 MaoC family dehydratase [Halosimplex rubrum]